jgi:uncharacterized membrane protein YbhN (UPF0104 family)
VNKHHVWRLATVTISLGIGYLSLKYILTRFEWVKALRLLYSADLRWLLMGGTASIVIYWLLRTWRWMALLRKFDCSPRFLDLYLFSAISLSLAIITPFQSGEALKVELLTRHVKIGRSQAYSALVFERWIDFLVIALLALAALLFSNDLIQARSHLPSVLIILIASVGIATFVLTRWKLFDGLHKFMEGFKVCITDAKTLALVLLLTFFSWTAVAIGWQVCLYSIGIVLSPGRSISLMSLVTVINVLSFIPGAVGVSEAGIAECLIRFGNNPIISQAGALILRVYSLLILFWGLLHFILLRASKRKRLHPDSTLTNREHCHSLDLRSTDSGRSPSKS